MVRPIMLLLCAIPILVAIFIVVPQLTRQDIPTAAVNSDDKISIEYSKQHLKQVSFGLTETPSAEKTEVLIIENDGETTYEITKIGYSEPEIQYHIEKPELKKLTALIKETGFMEIPPDSFPVKIGTGEYNKFGLKVTLNGKSVNVQWAEQNASQAFIPPLVTQVQSELDGIIAEIIK
jgi:hypothetical protein